jgi:sialate O-acetylesterase
MKTIVLVLLLAFTQQLTAQLKLPAFFTDGMVLQQKKVNRVWGWAKAQQLVKVNFKEKTYPAYANINGEWQVLLDAAVAGNAGTITVSAEGEKIVLNNILVGEVWVCGGQSNMEWVMKQCPEIYKEELATANNDQIRFVVVDHGMANTPKQDVRLMKKWTPITPATVGDCSAVAYWYAKKLYKELKVPIGLVVSSWGGTFAESWTSFEGLHDFPNYTQTFIEKIKPLDLENTDKQMKLLREKYQQSINEKTGFVQEVVKPDFDDSKWEEMYLPKQWEVQGYPALDGIAMYRVAFNIAAADAGKEAVLNMPAIDDMDSTYINGVFIGSINQWDALRKYTIPAGLLKAGKNILAIKVQDDGGGGGLGPLEEKFNVTIQQKIIPLAGKARFNIIAELEDITGGHGVLFHQPVVLYNAMIAPLQQLSIRGAIWYQGESNAENAKEYQTLFPAMINDWRNRWGQGDFPFLFVQLSSFGTIVQQPSQSNWAELREAQTMTLALPNTAMAVTLDIGEPGNIHPQKKKEVGERLAAGALKIVYGQSKLVSSGPSLKGFKMEGNQIVLQLKDIGNGLLAKGGKLKQFCIAGADKKFVWAAAVIRGNEIIVSSKLIQKPVAVRYAWADSPVGANLYNKEGFPAGSFRTDNW